MQRASYFIPIWASPVDTFRSSVWLRESGVRSDNRQSRKTRYPYRTASGRNPRSPAIAVNNGAAALFLVLNELAQGGEANPRDPPDASEQFPNDRLHGTTGITGTCGTGAGARYPCIRRSRQRPYCRSSRIVPLPPGGSWLLAIHALGAIRRLGFEAADAGMPCPNIAAAVGSRWCMVGLGNQGKAAVSRLRRGPGSR